MTEREGDYRQGILKLFSRNISRRVSWKYDDGFKISRGMLYRLDVLIYFLLFGNEAVTRVLTGVGTDPTYCDDTDGQTPSSRKITNNL